MFWSRSRCSASPRRRRLRAAGARGRPREAPAHKIARLRAARRLLGRRLWAIDTGGAPSILVATKYQEQVEAPYSGARVRISSIGRRDHIGAVRPTG